jgi:hypothetical protein
MIQVNVVTACSRCHNKSEQKILNTSKAIPHGMSREALQYNWHHCFFRFFVCNRNRTWTILNNPMSSKKGTKPPNKFKQHIIVTQCKYPFIQKSDMDSRFLYILKSAQFKTLLCWSNWTKEYLKNFNISVNTSHDKSIRHELHV